MVFCNIRALLNCMEVEIVTILILIDGFLQSLFVCITEKAVYCHNPYFNRWFSAIPMGTLGVFNDIGHNPYFNRWFSAISDTVLIIIGIKSHNPYFNRWFSAIRLIKFLIVEALSHNPYFNRWFSAIRIDEILDNFEEVTILILIDGFLQFHYITLRL